MSVCPRCASEDSKVDDTKRQRNEHGNIERRRVCQDCGMVFLTEERTVKVYIYDSTIMKQRAIDARLYLKTQN